MLLRFAALFTILVLLAFPMLVRADSTQQYNKILLSPYYYDDILKNTYAYFNVTIEPPDRISYVSSAIINMQTYVTSSPQDFVLQWKNGSIWSSCNNPSWRGTSSGFAVATFDCTNAIRSSGKYQFRITSTKDIGSTAGWLDLTYMNNPRGQAQISGTEYSRGDMATVFLQLTDNQGIPQNNASCYLDVWHPSTVNQSHPQGVFRSPMLKNNGISGLYFWDWSIPLNATLGVYMLSAQCSYLHSGKYVYSLQSGETYYPIRTGISGTYTGNEIFLNAYDDWIYTKCASTGGATKTCEAYYDFNTTIHFGTSLYNESGNITGMDLYYMGESSAVITGTFYVWNWTSSTWITLPNTITYSGAASSIPVGIGDFASNSLPTKDVINKTTGIIRIRMLSSAGAVFSIYNNWLNIQIMNAYETVTEVKGSGEMHVTDVAGLSANLSAAYVWNHSNRTLTNYNNTEIYSLLIGSSNLTAAQVWSYSIRTLTDYNLSGVESSISGIPNLTWMYPTRTLTDYNMSGLYALLADTNNTVYMNKASLATALVLLATINSTVYAIDSNTNSLPSWMSDLIATTHQTNATVNSIWAFLQNQTLNITVNATAIVNSTQIAKELAGFEYTEYYVTPQGSIPIVTGSLFGGIAYAAPAGYSSICLANNTLQTTVVKVRCIDLDCSRIETNTTEYCVHGCDFSSYPPSCMPSPSQSGTWFFVIIVILIIVMVFLVRWATKRY